MAIPKSMKAAVVEQFGAPLVVRAVPVPAPGPGQALVEISATGVCHTDLHAADGDWPVKPALPFIPGHEGAGIVAEGKVRATIDMLALESINDVFKRLRTGQVNGRVVLGIGSHAGRPDPAPEHAAASQP